MSEPNSALSMQELCTKIAKEAGTAYRGTDGTARSMLPIDKDDLQDIKDVINDGIRSFISDSPPQGWQWRKRILFVTTCGPAVEGVVDAAEDAVSIEDATLEDTYTADDYLIGYWVYILTGTGAGSYAQITDYTAIGGIVTVAGWLTDNGDLGGTTPAATDTFVITKYETINGDVGRYPLPEYFGGEVNGVPSYQKGTPVWGELRWVTESDIRRLRQMSISTGETYLLAIRQFEPDSGLSPKRRYELLVYPDPVEDRVIEFPYTLTFNKLNIESGIVTSVTAGSFIVADSTRDEADDYFNGWRLTIISGTGNTQSALVDSYVAATGSFTFTDPTWFTTEPDTTSVYIVEPPNNLHPAGQKFDQAVLSACMAKAEQKFENIQAGHVEEYLQKDLPQAWKADARVNLHAVIKAKSIPRPRSFKFLGKVQ
jgi:hypothetical protein